jgi:adenine-specific DNA-methyltransferase
VSGEIDKDNNRLVLNTESNGRFHSDWLSMMYPRLRLARNLLSENGVIFISIDDNEVGNLKILCDEIFGSACFVCQFTWVKKKKGSHLSDTHRSMTEYILTYARHKEGLILFGEAAYSDKLQPLAKKTNLLKKLVIPANTVRTTLHDGLVSKGKKGEGDSSLLFLNSFNVKNGFIQNEIQVEGPFVWTQSKLNEEIALGTTIHLSAKFGFNVGRYDQAEKFKAPSTLLNDVGTNEDAFQELSSLLGKERIFEFAKPVSLVQFLINAATYKTKSGLILDFFAGSGTTGHAVIAQNLLDNGNRKFILIQIPEEIKEERGSAFKFCIENKKPPLISEITKERLRRAIKKISEGKNKSENKLDTGIRVFKLDSSSLRLVSKRPEDFRQKELLGDVDNLKEDRTELDLLFHVLIDWGVDLSFPITKEKIFQKDVYSVDGDAIVACFEPKITKQLVSELAARKPLRAVFRDGSYESDSLKINVEQIFKLLSPDTEIKTL